MWSLHALPLLKRRLPVLANHIEQLADTVACFSITIRLLRHMVPTHPARQRPFSHLFQFSYYLAILLVPTPCPIIRTRVNAFQYQFTALWIPIKTPPMNSCTLWVLAWTIMHNACLYQRNCLFYHPGKKSHFNIEKTLTSLLARRNIVIPLMDTKSVALQRWILFIRRIVEDGCHRVITTPSLTGTKNSFSMYN